MFACLAGRAGMQALVPGHRAQPGPGVAGPPACGVWAVGGLQPPEAEFFLGHGQVWPKSSANGAKFSSVHSAHVPAALSLFVSAV